MSKSFSFACLLLAGLAATLSQTAFAGNKHKGPQEHKFTLHCTVNGLPDQMVTLERLRANDTVNTVDSQKVSPTGAFTLSGSSSEPGLYRIKFSMQRFIILSLDKGDVTVTASWPVNDYAVSGSASSAELKAFIDQVRTFMIEMNGANAKVDSLKASGNEAAISSLEAQMKVKNENFIKLAKNYADTTSWEPNAMLATRVMNSDGQLPYFEKFNASLDKRFPNTIMTREYHQFFERFQESQPAPTEVGDKAPNLKLRDTLGNLVSLDSYRGHYVLLDFWASWCGPCRAENPNVLAAYNKYKSKNFTILAVSLDNKKDLWLKAVRHDGLLWTQVSDLMGWQSPAAARYGVHAIPSNFLISPDGVILGKNLRGAELENKLDTVLK